MNVVFATQHVRHSAQATPLAAASLAAMLVERDDCSCRLLDFTLDDPADIIVREILAAGPDLVVVPVYVWNRTSILAACRKLGQEASGLFLLAGGPEATADPAGVIEEGALDAAIRGEGEETFAEIIGSLQEGETLTAIPGASLRTSDGVVVGPDRKEADPDGLPSPWLTGVLQPQPEGLLWEVARGCQFECTYCFDGLGRKGVAKLPVARLEAELRLFAESGVTQVWVLDSTFNHPPARGKQLLQLLAETAPDIHYHFEAKIDHLDEEMIQMLALLNCSVQVGLQSFHPQVLRAIHRTIDIELCVERMQMLSEAGITYGIDLIYGLPTGDLDGFRESLEAALSLQPNQVDLFPLSVLPGTRLHAEKEKYGIVADERPPYEIVSSETWSADMLEKARLLAAAIDLFYNLGRAVGFFEAIVRVTRREPVAFLEGFVDWLLLHQGIYRSVLIDIDCWRPEEVLAMQEGYVQFLLLRNGRNDLLQAALDLLRYHFHYADTLLEDEVRPLDAELMDDVWQVRWVLAGHIRCVPFSYEILDLLEMEEVDIEEFADLFRPVGSTALFFRRDGEVFCESMEEDLLALLKSCDGTKTPEEIFAGSVSRAAGEELVRFAAAEGFIVTAP